MTRQLVDGATSQMARHALIKLCSATPDAPTKLLGHPSVVTELKTQLESENSEARFRVHDVCVSFALLLPISLKKSSLMYLLYCCHHTSILCPLSADCRTSQNFADSVGGLCRIGFVSCVDRRASKGWGRFGPAERARVVGADVGGFGCDGRPPTRHGHHSSVARLAHRARRSAGRRIFVSW